MQPRHFNFGGGTAGTVLNPLVALGMLLAIGLILTLHRKKAVVPFLLAFFMVPDSQVLVLAGVHLTMPQILILTVLSRIVTFHGEGSEERFAGGFNAIDRVVVLWASVTLLMFYFQFMETQALIKALGDFIIYLGGYLAVRFLIPDGETVRRTIKVLALICLVYGVLMMAEQSARQNVFSQLGVPQTTVRDGHVRSQGVIGNLYSGGFAGVLFPLFIWLWTERQFRKIAVVGLISATIIAYATYASTSWMAIGGSLLGLGFWPLRGRMRLIRWGIVLTLIGLQYVMHGPVWSLIEKIDVTGGSSSYHRYMLVDNTIRHFREWWLFGFANHGAWGWDMYDLCNQFVYVAVTSGLLAFILYLSIYKRSFKALGDTRKQISGNREQEWLLWCFGCSLFDSIIASFGVNYMVHLMVCFLYIVVCISVMVNEVEHNRAKETEPAVKAHPWGVLSSV
jgi:hypothetical protein